MGIVCNDPTKRGCLTMKRPTDEQIAIASMWLESNEGEGEERAACVAVANWLQHQQREYWLRSEAKRHGISVPDLRRICAEAAADTHTEESKHDH